MFDWYSGYAFVIDVTLIQTLAVLSFYVVFRTGMLSLASAGLMAIGGYTSALLTLELGLPTAAGVVLAVGAGTLVGFLFALPVMRLGGIYFALGSLALGQATVVLIQGFEFTGAARGIVGIARDARISWIVPAILIAYLAFWLVERSHIGRAQRAIDLDERTAQGLGINVYWYKVGSFVASGTLASLAGALDAHRTGVVTPARYSFQLLVLIIAFTIVGGAGRWWGPVAVTLVFGVLRESLHGAGTNWEEVLVGILLIIVMVFAPRGLTDRRVMRDVSRAARRVLPGGNRSPSDDATGQPPERDVSRA